MIGCVFIQRLTQVSSVWTQGRMGAGERWRGGCPIRESRREPHHLIQTVVVVLTWKWRTRKTVVLRR